MTDFPVALQMYSVRDEMQKDFYGTIKTAHDMGYDGVEFAGLFGHSADEIKSMCDDIGITVISAHVPVHEMKNIPDLFEQYAKMGCKYVAIPSGGDNNCAGNPGFPEFVETVKALGAKAKQNGIQLCYHNHNYEFEKMVDGKHAIDVLYESVPADLLQPQFDTCWVNVGGENPAAYLRKYAGRVGIVHLKDFTGGRAEKMYAILGEGEDSKETSEEFQFRPVGYGLQDIPAILAAAKEAGSEWMVVEQDLPSKGKTPLECAEMSIRYLKNL